MDAAGDAPKLCDEGENALNGDPEMDDEKELPCGC